jgi:hypothetical protein
LTAKFGEELAEAEAEVARLGDHAVEVAGKLANLDAESEALRRARRAVRCRVRPDHGREP